MGHFSAWVDEMNKEQEIIDLKSLDSEEIEKIIHELDKADIEDTDKYVMKELITGNDDNVVFKTELTITQIKTIVKLLTLDRIIRIQSKTNINEAEKIVQSESVIKEMTMLLMKLLVSHQRKGRYEFIDAYRSDRENKQGQGFLKKWFRMGEE